LLKTTAIYKPTCDCDTNTLRVHVAAKIDSTGHFPVTQGSVETHVRNDSHIHVHNFLEKSKTVKNEKQSEFAKVTLLNINLPGIAIRAIMGLVAITALEMDWTEDDTVKTTVNGISNITFIERRHACRTELLKNGDGRTDGRVFSSPRPPVGDRPDEAVALALHDGD